MTWGGVLFLLEIIILHLYLCFKTWSKAIFYVEVKRTAHVTLIHIWQDGNGKSYAVERSVKTRMITLNIFIMFSFCLPTGITKRNTNRMDIP